MTASKAAGLCSELSNPPNGAASLVVFGQDDPSHAEEEREQVFYELLHLPSVVAGTTPEPTDFWIGLSSSSTDAGVTWTWDDGHLEDYFPLPWGNHEPKAKEPGVRAFSLQTGTTAGYEAPATTYDTQLAHARDPADAGADGGDGGDGGGAVDAGVELHAVLCQQYSMTHWSAAGGELESASNPLSPDAGEFRAYVGKSSEIRGKSSEIRGKLSEVVSKLSANLGELSAYVSSFSAIAGEFAEYVSKLSDSTGKLSAVAGKSSEVVS
jgi:hypothetical protein